MAKNRNYRKIAIATGKSYGRIEFLCQHALDKDMGEYIDHVTDEGVYLMDVTNACGDYTMIPIPFGNFVQMLEHRIHNCNEYICVIQ